MICCKHLPVRCCGFIHSYVRLSFFCITLLLSSFHTVNASAEEQSNDPGNQDNIDEIIITASRVPQPLSHTIASVTVISRKDIEAVQAKSINDVLRTVPGIDIAHSGGRGQIESIYMRGTDTKQVLILVDGVRIGSATLGSTSLGNIPVAHIERIEVVRGPRSSIYGSDALGGIIQIFTRKGSTQAQHAISLGFGGESSADINFSSSGQLGSDTQYALSLAYENTDGFNARNDYPGFFGPEITDKDDDGYRNRSFSARINHHFNSNWHWELNGTRSEGNGEFDTSFGGDERDFENYTIASRLAYESDTFNSALTVSGSQDFSVDFGNGVNKNTADVFETDRFAMDWLNRFILASGLSLTVGVDWYEDNVGGSDTVYSKSERDNTGVFAELIVNKKHWDFQAGLRHEDNSQFGNHSTYSIGAAVDFAGNHRASLNIGSAFKAPSFNDLFWPNAGNPDLQPEESESIEFGIEGDYEVFSWNLDIYRTDIDNLIEWAPDDLGMWIPQNVSEVKIDGAELALEFSVLGIDNQLVLEVTDPVNSSNGSFYEGNVVLRRVRKSVKWQAERAFGDTHLAWSYLYKGPRFDDAGNSVKLAAYGVWDVRLSHQFNKHIIASIRGENLFDKKYQAVGTYNTQRRIFYFHLKYSF